MKTNCVMDASAILALIGQEPGADVVAGHMAGSVMSALGWSEVIIVLHNIGMTSQDVENILRQLSVRILPFDTEQAVIAASLHRITHTKGLSLASRACLALGRTYNIPVITAQSTWSSIHAGIEVILIR